MNDKTLFIGVIILGLFFTAFIARNGDLVWMALLFIVYLGTGIGQSPAKEDIHLRVRRSVEKTKRDGSFFVEVIIHVRNDGRRTISFFIADPLQNGMAVTEGSLSLQAALHAGEDAELKYVFEADHGSFSWQNIHVTASDPFGLIETKIIIDDGSEALVQPALKKFRPFPLRLWKTLSSPGSIPVRMGGNGTEFWGVREYHSGDPLKLLDWRMTARHPHQFFTREFVQEKTAEISIILDARQKMNITAGEENLFEIETKTAASIAEMFIRQGHRVGLFVAGKSLLRVFPNYGKLQLQRIMNCLARAEIKTDSNNDPLYRLPLDQISRKSMMMVISPSDMSDIRFYRRLRAFGFDVMLICPDTFDFAEPILARDPLTHLALRASRLERKLHLRMISQLSISVIDWRVKEPLLPLMRNVLRRPLRIKRM